MAEETLFYLSNWLVFVSIFCLAAISPGPDFVIVVQNSLLHSRRIGVLTAIGLSLGVIVHATYTLAGLAAVFIESSLIFNSIKWLSAAYLVYIGLKNFRSVKNNEKNIINQNIIDSSKNVKVMTDKDAIRLGFLTNLLNPKATLFFIAIFSQLVPPQISIGWKLVYGLSCVLITAGWFSLVACILTQNKIRSIFLQISPWIDKICGMALICLGIKIAFMSK